jgi:hypothetical protein
METKDLGPAIDALYALREARLDLERKAKDMKSQELEMRGAILECLDESGLSKASGLMATAGKKITIVPLVTDWDQVFGYIKQNDRFDLVQKRISVLAWRATLDEGGLIPGTEPVEEQDISLTKASRS